MNDIKISDCEQPIVIVYHPWGTLEVSLEDWVQFGPGKRQRLRPSVIKCADGTELSINRLPLKYRNTWFSRLLIRIKLLSAPWSNT